MSKRMNEGKSGVNLNGGWYQKCQVMDKASKGKTKSRLVLLFLDQTGHTLWCSVLTKRQDYILGLFVLPLTSLHSDTLMRPDTRLLSKFSC